MWSAIKAWRVGITYAVAIATAAVGSAILIVVLFLSISRIETALPRFGFYSIREFHIAIRDVTHLRDMISLARSAPSSPESVAFLSEANDLVYIRFERLDGRETIAEIPAYAGIVPQISAAVARLDGIIAAGVPMDKAALDEVGLQLDQIVNLMNDAYYKFGEEVNVDLYATELALGKFNYQITFALTLLSLLAIGTAVLFITRRENVKKLEFLAWRDTTTGLKNRAWMSANRDTLMDSARAAGRQLRLFLIDLDHFKSVNDTFGHHTGDLLLKAVGEILESVERPGEVVGVRLGGDEFALMAIADGGAADDGLGDHLRQQLNRFVDLEGRQVRIGASIGMAHFPEHGSDISTLLRHADRALYAAKAEGRSGFVTFSSSILSQVDMQLAEEAAIKRALNQDEFFLVWQAQFELASGRLTGAEALVRWRDQVTGEILPPCSFIPTAEKSDLILEIDKVVLRKACAQAAQWMPISSDDFICAVNVSGKSLQNAAFLDCLTETLQKTGLPSRRLQLEITEGVFIEDSSNALEALAKIRDMGVSTALDDFGSGYSSLRYLADFELDRVKLDKSFLDDLEYSKKKQNIIRGIIALANSLGLRVIAEGVENEAQLAFLIAQGCHGGQGFLMSKPVDEGLFTNQLIVRHGSRGKKPNLKLASSA